MEMKIFAIKDSKAGMFNSPFFQPTHGTAERSFKELLKDPQSFVSKYPEDYDLYYLGTYDDITGVVKPEQPQHVVSGSQLSVQA